MYKIDRAFKFQRPNADPFATRIQGINLITQDITNQAKRPLACQLQLRLSQADHTQLQKAQLFGYQADLCTPLTQGPFNKKNSLTARLILDPDHLPLLKNCSDASSAAAQLLLEPKDSPLHQAESWRLLSVRQRQSNKKQTSYRTFWDYLDWEELADSLDLEAQMGQQLQKFLAESSLSRQLAHTLNLPTDKASHVTRDLSAALLSALPGLLSQDTQSMAQFTDAIADLQRQFLTQQFSEVMPQLTPQIPDAENLANEMARFFPADVSAAQRSTSLWETAIAFLHEAEWPVDILEDQALLRLMVQGKSGQWLGLLEHPNPNQLLFYSVSTTKVPPQQQATVAQFLMALNYSQTNIGSFELDRQDGEFRYKTGGTFNRWDEQTIENLIYPNLAVMDQHLPLIGDVVMGRCELQEAMKLLP
ncbi:MAG: YbjN domain-containing protein [Spirulina sp. SIO3F2]|nr:YbjN domain-containing protein [Spirulina sp. SIO3F2]